MEGLLIFLLVYVAATLGTAFALGFRAFRRGQLRNRPKHTVRQTQARQALLIGAGVGLLAGLVGVWFALKNAPASSLGATIACWTTGILGGLAVGAFLVWLPVAGRHAIFDLLALLDDVTVLKRRVGNLENKIDRVSKSNPRRRGDNPPYPRRDRRPRHPRRQDREPPQSSPGPDQR